MGAPRARSDEKKMARFAEFDAVPHAFRHDNSLARFHGDLPISVCLFENHVQPTGYEVEDFVSVGVNFAAMGRISPHPRGTDRESIGPRWRAGCSSHNRLPVMPESEKTLRQVNRIRRTTHEDTSAQPGGWSQLPLMTAQRRRSSDGLVGRERDFDFGLPSG